MSARTVLWKDRHIRDRVLGFVGKRLAALFEGKKSKEHLSLSLEEFLQTDDPSVKSVHIRLPNALAFKDQLEGRSTSYRELQNIFSNQADAICPISDEPHTLLAKLDPTHPSLIHCLTLRDETLEAINAKAQSLFLSHIVLSTEADPSFAFAAPMTLTHERFTREAWAIACTALLASLWLCGNIYAHRLETNYDTKRTYEARLRTQVLERSENARKITAYDTLANQGISEFTVSARINALQNLNSATPKTAWWHQVSFDEQDMTLSGTSQNAATVLQALSENYPGYTAGFMRPLTNQADGTQTYAIRLAGDES